MKIKAVLFDLDGTLLPMDQDTFIKAYLGGLVGLLSPHGYKAEDVASALWASTRAMMKNDGSMTNENRFWQSFSQILGDDIRDHEGELEEFYKTDFQKIQQLCPCTPRAREIIDLVKSLGLRVILATSPLFPAIATESRIRWAGLTPDDFELYTTYENSIYCKPNPMYYKKLLEELSLSPEECVMIGNDVGDDMIAESLGIKCFLLTDCLINRKNEDITKYTHGDYNALVDFIKEIINEN
jgi:FMN phosphatase YigB (HAD superfamily)